MKWIKRLILLTGAATIAYLFWRLDPSAVWANVSRIGAGMGVIMLLPFFDHFLNSWGWRFTFNAKNGRAMRLWRLFLTRIAGDGVNYLTPSATIAGEMVRPAMLGDGASQEAKISSVVIARFTQSLGQAFFIMFGLLFVVTRGLPLQGRLPLFEIIQRWFYVPLTVLALSLAALAVYAAKTWAGQSGQPARRPMAAASAWLSVKLHLGDYFLDHPGRFTASIIFFMAGYFWGAVEVFLICRFMGAPVTPIVALAIEVFSSIFEGVLFMVPAKMGTQEAGKTAIFTGLGLPAAQGLALGLIRHVRELTWAAIGFLLYAAYARRQGKAGSPKETGVAKTGRL